MQNFPTYSAPASAPPVTQVAPSTFGSSSYPTTTYTMPSSGAGTSASTFATIPAPATYTTYQTLGTSTYYSTPGLGGASIPTETVTYTSASPSYGGQTFTTYGSSALPASQTRYEPSYDYYPAPPQHYQPRDDYYYDSCDDDYLTPARDVYQGAPAEDPYYDGRPPARGSRGGAPPAPPPVDADEYGKPRGRPARGAAPPAPPARVAPSATRKGAPGARPQPVPVVQQPPPPIEEEPEEEFVLPADAKITSRGFILPDDHGDPTQLEVITEANTTSVQKWDPRDSKHVFKLAAQGEYAKVRDAIEAGFPLNCRYSWKGSGLTLLSKMSGSSETSPYFGKTITDIAGSPQLYQFLRAIGGKHAKEFVGEASKF